MFTLEHLVPQSFGGSDELDNLALACRRCNERRYNFTIGIDSETGLETPLFQPRQQVWAEHFIWTADGVKIISLTSVGRLISCTKRLEVAATQAKPAYAGSKP